MNDDAFYEALAELEIYLEEQAEQAAPTCQSCINYLQSPRTGSR